MINPKQPMKHFNCSDIGIKNIESINDLKKKYDLKNNGELLSKLLDDHLIFDEIMDKKLSDLCLKMNMSRSDLLVTVVDRYINKTLKGYGIVKEKHKKSANAETELLEILKEMISYYNNKPIKERKYLTASLVHRYILSHPKYKQKHINVIKRVLAFNNNDFIKKYHDDNKLTSNTNRSKKV